LSRFGRALARSALGVAVLVLWAGSAQADGGALDPTFAGTGIATMALAGSGDLNAVAVQPDGKIVAGGFVGLPGAQNGLLAVVRYTAAGSLDPSFGHNGLVTTDVGTGVIYALAVQPDGKIVAAGGSYQQNPSTWEAVFVRYNVDGSLDSTFGDGGIVGPTSAGNAAIAIQPDGKIVTLVGGGPNIALFRYNADGSPDAAFGWGGQVVTSSPNSEYGAALALVPGGRIIVAGASSSPNDLTNASILMRRYNSDGSLDTSFGSNGAVVTPAGVPASASSVVLQPDGKILLAGDALVGSQYVSALARYAGDGALDTSFGDQGVVLTGGANLGYVDGAHSVLLQHDGKIVTVSDGLAWGWGFGLARHLPDGAMDAGFGDGGIVTTTFGAATDGGTRAAALEPDGKVVVVGSTWPASPGAAGGLSFQIARYLSDDSHPLNVDKAYSTGNGTITSAPAGIACDSTCFAYDAQFADQSLVTLKAHPLDGAAVSWRGACSGSKNECTVTMQQAARAVHVSFSLCVVPRVTGKRLAAARHAIRHAHCSVGRTKKRFSFKVPRGRVISQSPRRGRTLAANAKVKLVVSRGRR